MKSMASLKVIISFGVIFGPQLSFCQGPCIGEQCPETNRGDTSTLLQSKAGVKQVREHHQVPEWDLSKCPHNAGRSACWADSAYQTCSQARQKAYDQVCAGGACRPTAPDAQTQYNRYTEMINEPNCGLVPEWDLSKCPHNAGRSACWADSAYQTCSQARQKAYDQVCAGGACRPTAPDAQTQYNRYTEMINEPNCGLACITTGPGSRSGHACVFPFNYRGTAYNACTSLDHTGFWCSTQTDAQNFYIKGNWGDCSATCPQVPEWDLSKCPHNAGRSACWADSAYQTCSPATQKAYDQVCAGGACRPTAPDAQTQYNRYTEMINKPNCGLAALTQTLDTKEDTLPICSTSSSHQTAMMTAFLSMNDTCRTSVQTAINESFVLEDHKEELCPCILQIDESTANSLSGCRLTDSCNCAATSVWEKCQLWQAGELEDCPLDQIQAALSSVNEICKQQLGMMIKGVKAGGPPPEMSELCPCLSQVPQEVADLAMDCKLPGSEYPAGKVIEMCKAMAAGGTPA